MKLYIGALLILLTPMVQGATVQELTFDVSGTFPANCAKSKLTAPNASFLIEFTVKQLVPATPSPGPLFFQTPLIAASYSFEGLTHPAPSTSSFLHSDSAGNLESITLTFKTGTFLLSSTPIFHSPILAMHVGADGRFVAGNLGAGLGWRVQYTPIGAPAVNNPVSVSEVVSRVALP
ncbi:MAG TPA: hypothetical protein VGD78_15555 [Chthoniobacterales bacterium]